MNSYGYDCINEYKKLLQIKKSEEVIIDGLVKKCPHGFNAIYKCKICKIINRRITIRKELAKRKRHLGFIPLNKPFNGSEGHHIDKLHIVYIPKELHRSIRHNVFTGKGMNDINTLTSQWFKINFEFDVTKRFI